jgi:hypothetical protein
MQGDLEKNQLAFINNAELHPHLERSNVIEEWRQVMYSQSLIRRKGN